MASKRIKGITIEIGADTPKLTQALKDADRQVSNAKLSPGGETAPSTAQMCQQ